MYQKFVIPGRLPGLNEIIASSRTHWAVAEYRQDLIKELEDEIARLGGAK